MRLSFALTSFLVCATSSAAATISITQVFDAAAFVAPGFVINSIRPNAINNSGAIAGTASVLLPGYITAYGFVRQPDGSLSYYQATNGGSTSGASINNNGQIAGGTGGPIYNAPPNQRYIRNPDGSVLLFDGPFPSNTLLYPVALNDGGVVAFSTYAGSFVGFPQGPYASVNLPQNATIAAINDQGLIAGQFSVAGNVYGYIRSADDATFTTLDFSNYVVPTGMNNQGDVVGYYLLNYPGGTPLSYPMAGFYRFANGELVTFNGLSPYTEFLGVNDLGQILGSFGSSVDQHFFIADVNAVPEPSSGLLSLLFIGLLCRRSLDNRTRGK